MNAVRSERTSAITVGGLYMATTAAGILVMAVQSEANASEVKD